MLNVKSVCVDQTLRNERVFLFQDYANMDDFSLNLDNVTENMFDHFKVNLKQKCLQMCKICSIYF